MNKVLAVSAVFALLLVEPARAFQEETIAPATSSQGESVDVQAPAVELVPTDPTTDISDDVVRETRPSTEVSIPGLGRLGVLPKLDFGLELLYGADEPASGEPVLELDDDDITIRGRAKYNF